MKTITLFSREFPPILLGGIGNTAKYLSDELSKSNYKVNVVTPKFGEYSNLPAIENKQNMTIYRIQMKHRLLFWTKTILFSRKLKSDLTHLLNARDGPFIKKNSPIIANINDYYPLDIPFNYFRYPYNEKGKLQKYLNYQLFKFLDFTSLQRADLVISNSEYTKNLVSKGYKLKGKHVVVYKGTNIKEIEAKSQEKTIDVLFAGSPLSTKGAKEFIYAVKILKEKNKNIKAVMVGRPSKLDIDYNALIKKLGLQENISYIGFLHRTKLIELYHKSKIYAMPSYREAFGQTLIEAMAAKVPIVASNVGGIAEVVGKAGLLVEVFNFKELAQKLQILLNDPNLRKEMGEIGFCRVKEKFDFKDMIRKYMEIYKEFV